MRGSAVPVTLPPKQTTVIEIVQTQALEPIFGRPDLALTPLDTVLEGETVRGVLHNIGSAAVARCEVALMNPAGEIVKRQEVGPVPAPEDLNPVRVPYEFDGLPEDIAGWRVVVDHDDAVAEIHEGNNELALAR
jgi:hypothetical protein